MDKRGASAEQGSEHQNSLGGAFSLSVPAQPNQREAPGPFSKRYRPNSVFLAQLIASTKIDFRNSSQLQKAAEICANTYREMAALPRRRSIGYLFKITK